MTSNNYILGSLQSAAKLLAIFFISVHVLAQQSSSAPQETVTSAAQGTKSIVLAKDWDTPMQGGSATMQDLGRILAEYAKPEINLDGDDSIVVYPGIPYLSPVRQALETLRPGTRLPSKVLVSCPGFPRDSFYYYAIGGLFEGHFNRAYVVTDRADQVVSVEFVDEHPINQTLISRRAMDWHTYDFVNDRTKSMNTLRIEHLPSVSFKDRWTDMAYGVSSRRTLRASEENWNMFRLRSTLLQPVRADYRDRYKVMQETLWFVPRPIAELILACVQKSIK